MNVRIRRVRGRASNLAQTVVVTATVAAEVVDGRVTQEELTEWVRQAIQHYHTFRIGHVGHCGIVGRIRLPSVETEK